MGDSLVMKQMWLDAEARFKARTGLSLRLSPSRTLNDCLAEVESRQLPEDVDSVPYKASGIDKAKQSSLDVLHCLKLLGGVAAEGASMVFPPSSICFNALSLLLDIPATIHSFHGAIDGLFETLGPSLSVFRIYDKVEQFESIAPELKQAVHKLMISFVDICALSITLRNSGKWKKWKVGIKRVLLDDDSGVKDEIDRFKELSEAHTSIQGTQTLKTVLETNSAVAEVLNKASETGRQISEINSNVISLTESDEKRKADETSRKNMEKIRKKLDPDRSATNASNERCDKLYQNCVPGTANFLENRDEHPEFQKWAERDETSAHALFSLTGGSNTGKSFIISSLVHYLRSIYDSPNRQSPRTLIACYSFPDIFAKGDQDKLFAESERADRRPIETALKSIALQFAEADAAYAKRISTDCSNKEDVEKFLRDASPKELWSFLGLGAPRGKTAHYIIIDGLSSLPEPYADGRAQMLDIMEKLTSGASSVRILLSLRPDTLLSVGKDLAYTNLDVEKHTENDIRLFINHELKVLDVLQDTDEDSTMIRQRIQDKLSVEVGGNYYKVETALGKIKAIVDSDGSEAEVDQVLEESSKDERAISEAVIKRMEDSLKAEEIRELNELLTWVVFGWRYFNVEELNVIMLLASKTRSILRLEKKLKGKYAEFFAVSNGLVRVADGMEELLRKERTEPRDSDETPKFSATITITKADMTSVQSFLWNFMQKVTQDNFGFQQLMEHEGVKKNIEVNEFDSNLRMLLQTFPLLAEKPDKKTQTLLPYLLGHLPQHLEVLEKATGLDMLTPTEKREIGDGLFMLFVDGDVIERHWDSCGDVIWYRLRENLESFLRWLREPTITSHLGRLDRAWLRSVAADRNPCCALMTKVMETIARRWLQNKEWDVLRPCQWLREFLTFVVLDETGQIDTSAFFSELDMATIDMVEDWCKQLLNLQEVDLLWEERLAQTRYTVGHYPKAIEKFQAVLEQGGPSLTCFESLAESFAGDLQYLKACETMDKALGILTDEDPLNYSAISRDYRLLSKWYAALGQSKREIEYIHKAFDMTPEDRDVLYDLLVALINDENVAEITKLLQNLSEIPIDQAQQTLFGKAVEDIVNNVLDEQFGQFCAIVVAEPNLVERTLQELDRSIERAKSAGDLEGFVELLFHKGAFIQPTGTDGTPSPQPALECWNQCLNVNVDGGWTIGQASSLVGVYHFDQARTSEDPETQRKHLESIETIINSQRRNVFCSVGSYIASFHLLDDNPSKAKSVLQSRAHTAFDMLLDNTDDNDWQAYSDLSSCLMFSGDILNALSAFSLLLTTPENTDVMGWLLDFEEGPDGALAAELTAAMRIDGDFPPMQDQLKIVLENLERRRVGASEVEAASCAKIQSRLDEYPNMRIYNHWTVSCDGCSAKLDFENAMHVCRYCENTGFCDKCLQILKTDRLKAPPVRALICNKTHDWLRLPAWTRKTYLEPLKGSVWVGGEFVDGVRVGGEIVTISTWLDGLKREWGYAERVKTPDGEDNEAEKERGFEG